MKLVQRSGLSCNPKTRVIDLKVNTWKHKNLSFPTYSRSKGREKMFAEFFSNSKKVLNSKWLILLKLHPHKLSAMAGAVKSSRKTRRKLGRSSFGATALNDLWKTRIQATNNRQILNVLHRSRLDLEREGSRLSDCSFAVQKCTNPYPAVVFMPSSIGSMFSARKCNLASLF